MKSITTRRLWIAALSAILYIATSMAMAQAPAVVTTDDFKPVFGPKSYFVPNSGHDSFRDEFKVGDNTSAGPIEGRVIIINGSGRMDRNTDGGDLRSARVTSGTVYLNGAPIARINLDTGIAQVPARLRGGANVLGLRIAGRPGAAVTITILAKIPREPPINVGVLQLPYGSIEPPYVLEFCLKNKSHEYPRSVRLACISADGQFSDISRLFEIKPNGTLKIRLPNDGLNEPPPSSLNIAPEPWIEGSINLIWVGRGHAPVVGYVVSGAASTDSALIRDRVVLPLVPQKPPKPEPRPDEDDKR